jgi:hypothetical protein
MRAVRSNGGSRHVDNKWRTRESFAGILRALIIAEEWVLANIVLDRLGEATASQAREVEGGQVQLRQGARNGERSLILIDTEPVIKSASFFLQSKLTTIRETL